MLNKEKYKDEIFEIACSGNMLALNKHTRKLENCSELSCTDCSFDLNNHWGRCSNCSEMCYKWCNSEYKEPEIDWSKVPVDTPVYVNMSGTMAPRYFAKYEDNSIYHFKAGKTSFTNQMDALMPVSKGFIKLARLEDIEKYSK